MYKTRCPEKNVFNFFMWLYNLHRTCRVDISLLIRTQAVGLCGTVKKWEQEITLSIITPPKIGGVIWDTSLTTFPGLKTHKSSVRNPCYYLNVKFVCIWGLNFSQSGNIPNYPTKIKKNANCSNTYYRPLHPF